MALTKEQILDTLRERLERYKYGIENDIIEYSTFIVEVGALTVGTEPTGKIIAQNILFPTQFSKTALEIILSMNWKDGDGKNINPKVFHKNDWYQGRIKLIQETLSLMN